MFSCRIRRDLRIGTDPQQIEERWQIGERRRSRMINKTVPKIKEAEKEEVTIISDFYKNNKNTNEKDTSLEGHSTDD